MVHRLGLMVAVSAALAIPAAADRINVPPPGGPDPVAVAIVIEGDVIHLTDPLKIEKDDGGKFAAFQLALDTIAGDAPHGSMGALIVYYDHAQVLRELGPLATLRGDALGRIDDYQDKTGRNLVDALTRALDEVSQAPCPRRAVIIAGDGADNQLDTSPEAMRNLKERARDANIAIYSIAMDAGIGDSMTALRYVAPRERFAAKGVLDIVPAFEGTFHEILAGKAAPRDDVPEPVAAAATPGANRTIAWSLLVAGVALGAFAAAVLIRRRAAPTGRPTGRSS